jgi:hypothetical protein
MIPVLVLLASSQVVDTHTQDLVEFHKMYQVYFREYFGCPHDALVFDHCNPELGKRDAKLFKKLGSKAAETFPRQDKQVRSKWYAPWRKNERR